MEIHPGQVTSPSRVTNKCTVKWWMCACPWHLHGLPLMLCPGSWVRQVDLQLLVAKPWRRAIHCLGSELCLPMRSTTTIYFLKRVWKGPVLLANRSHVFIPWNASLQFSGNVLLVCFFKKYKAAHIYDVMANYVCNTSLNSLLLFLKWERTTA